MLLKAYLATIDPPDVSAARRLANRSIDQGMGSLAFIEQVLVPAQEEVGRRWQSNEYTVPQEHAATAVADAVLATLSARVPGDRSIPGRIVTCCVEGEWHTLPIRMVNDSLAMQGHDVVYLGPSVPSPQLSGFLRDVNAMALVASCTAANSLVGARRTVAAAHEAGVPVIIGGRGLGGDGVRAANLGADAWAPSVSAANHMLGEWVESPPALGRSCEVEPEQAALADPRPGLIDDCLGVLLERTPRLRGMSASQLERTREDIGYILEFCSAALVVSDPTVLDDFTSGCGTSSPPGACRWHRSPQGTRRSPRCWGPFSEDARHARCSVGRPLTAASPAGSTVPAMRTSSASPRSCPSSPSRSAPAAVRRRSSRLRR